LDIQLSARLSAHNKMADALNEMRNEHDPVAVPIPATIPQVFATPVAVSSAFAAVQPPC
jgi:hypothetical protein